MLLTRRKHVHDRITSLIGEVWAHETSLTQPLFIKVPKPRVLNLPISMIYRLHFRTFTPLWYISSSLYYCNILHGITLWKTRISNNKLIYVYSILNT